MVIKSGRFGRFLACPGYPECTFTKPLVVAMPGRCPKCSGRILKKTSRNGYTYYACEHNSDKDEAVHCDFMSWDVPVADDCPVCGQTMFKKSGKGFKKPFCINEQCANFTPEAGSTEAAPEKKEAKKPAKKASSKSVAAKKASAEKTTQRKAAAKKPAKKDEG